MAIGAINALREHDFSVPGDMSVIGFDDIYYASLFSPKLTTIRQPLELIGEKCMQVLLELLNSKKPVNKRIELPTELVVRNSTGPVKQTS